MLLENNPYPEDVRVRQEAEALVAAGHAVCVLAPRGPGQPRRETVRGVEVRRFRLPPAGERAAAIAAEYGVATAALHAGALRALVRGATVLHLHNPPDTLFPAAAVARALGRRVVFDHHDLFPELVAARLGSRRLEAAARLLERATFATADRVLAANESHAAVARERGGVAPGAVTVVRNGPPAAWIAAEPDVAGGALTAPHLVYVGAIAPQDGAELLADVLALLRDVHGLPGARLTVVGDGDARPALERRLREQGVLDRATVTGWVTPDAVRTHLRAADVCVDPAPPTPLNHRSTMIKVAEYLAAGKPVAAFDLHETSVTAGGAAELAAAGDVADLAARIAALAGDGARRRELAARGLRRARELTWERSAEALVGVYAAL